MGVTTDVAVVEVVDVSKSFGRVVALDGLSMTLHTGVTGLLGPNGAGKTTLMRCIATVLSPDRGSIRLFGIDTAERAHRLSLRRRIGFMPQEFGFYERFSVEAFLDYAGVMKQIADGALRRSEIDRVLEVTSLGEYRRRRIRHLSGGMRRRLGLAVALLGDPQLLILDEPTVGLDPEQRYLCRELISKLGSGRAVLLSTHLSEDVAALASRTIVLDHGRVRYDGPIDGLAEIATGRVWITAEEPDGAIVSWRQPNGEYRALGPRTGLREEPPTVEDGYLLLVGGAGKTG